MKFGPFRILPFIIVTITFGILAFISFVAFFAIDEGATDLGFIETLLAKLFYIFCFPTQPSFWSIVIKDGITAFISTLIFNCVFYGFITERVYSYFVNKRVKRSA
jgi:hypothetical protein